MANTDYYTTAELLFQVLGRCEVIGMGMGFPKVVLPKATTE